MLHGASIAYWIDHGYGLVGMALPPRLSSNLLFRPF